MASLEAKEWGLAISEGSRPELAIQASTGMNLLLDEEVFQVSTKSNNLPADSPSLESFERVSAMIQSDKARTGPLVTRPYYPDSR